MYNILYKKLTCLLLIVAGTVATTNAQQLQWQWGTQGKSNSNATVSGMVADNEGNIFVTGNFSDTITFGAIELVPQGQTDIFVVKYNPAGKTLWAKAMGSEGKDYASTIYATTDGNLYIAGMVSKEAKFDETIVGNKKYNLFIAALSGNGDLHWINSWETKPGDYITTIASDSLGNGYFGGYFEKKMTVDGRQIKAEGKADAFLLCTDSTGRLQWLQQWGGRGNDKITALSFSENKLWITGTSRSGLEIGTYSIKPSSKQFESAFMASCAPDGSIIAIKKIADGTNLHTACIQQLTDRNIIVGGSFSDLLLLDTNALRSYGNHDIFLTTFDTSGTTLWQKQVGSTGFDRLYDIIEQPATGIVVTGIYSGLLLVGCDTTAFDSRRADLFSLSLGYTGEQQWITTTKGRMEQFPAGLARDPKGDIYIAGTFRDTVKIRRSVLAAPQDSYNVFLAKLRNCEQPELLFACDTVFTEGATLLLTLKDSYSSYRWEHGQSVEPSYKVSCSGIYSVRVTDSLQCVHRDSIKVEQVPAKPKVQIRAHLQLLQNSTPAMPLLAVKLEVDLLG